LNPYRHFVSEFARVVCEGADCPLGGIVAPAHTPPAADAPVALIFSPHPDDEAITGGLALRLLRECGWNVINVALTLGSKPERRAERLEELKGACGFLGFGLLPAAPGGLEKVSVATRTNQSEFWSASVGIVADIIRQRRPRVIFFPHKRDWNSTHIGAHWLVADALREVDGLSCYLVETEYWGQMASPNLLVEYRLEDVADLVAAVSFHAGEVRRNPYHLRLPAWLQDNARRGGELVGGQGKAAPDFVFAQLFRMRRWRSGRMERCISGGRYLSAAVSADEVFGLSPILV
jgi:LmbE family N-acetylglucosaminyl deacetylase